MDLHNWISINRFMDLHNSFMEIHNSIMEIHKCGNYDLHKWIMDLHKWIMNLHKWIMDLHNSGILSPLALHTSGHYLDWCWLITSVPIRRSDIWRQFHWSYCMYLSTNHWWNKWGKDTLIWGVLLYDKIYSRINGCGVLKSVNQLPKGWYGSKSEHRVELLIYIFIYVWVYLPILIYILRCIATGDMHPQMSTLYSYRRVY